MSEPLLLFLGVRSWKLPCPSVEAVHGTNTSINVHAPQLSAEFRDHDERSRFHKAAPSAGARRAGRASITCRLYPAGSGRGVWGRSLPPERPARGFSNGSGPRVNSDACCHLTPTSFLVPETDRLGPAGLPCNYNLNRHRKGTSRQWKLKLPRGGHRCPLRLE